MLAAQDIVGLAEFYREKTRLMGAAVWAAGWDCARFRRAYDAFGKPVGSSLNDEWQIFSETQGMCVRQVWACKMASPQRLWILSRSWRPRTAYWFSRPYIPYTT